MFGVREKMSQWKYNFTSMNVWIWCTVLVISTSISTACTNLETEKAEPEILRYEIIGDSSYTAMETVGIEFVLYNLTDDSLSVLTWYTPFEGIKGNIFDVYFKGEKLLYLGRMVKRGNPTLDDYVSIPPQGKISTRVDLHREYDFSSPGEYSVEFVGVIHDISKRGEVATKPVDSPKRAKAFGKPTVLYIFDK